MTGKPSTKLFYKIGEVCRLTDIKPHILRYWESEFPALAPRKSRGGQRVYEPKDLEMVKRIKRMLYEEGYTIAGARKHLSGRGAGRAGAKAASDTAGAKGRAGALDARTADALGRFKKEIQELLDIISG